MPISPMPATIELSDFSGGWVPKAEEVGVTPDSVLAASNLMVETTTGSVTTRKGFKRVFDTAALDGYRLYSLHPYTDKNGVRYIMCVFSSGFAGIADNVQVWRFRVSDSNFVRVDTAGRAWSNANGRHWGATVDGVYYGGGEGEKMYSYDPTRGTPWNADPGTPNPAYPTWIEQGTTPTSIQRARDYAFKNGDGVLYSGLAYKARKDIRFDLWSESGGEDGKYAKGDRVSTNTAISTSGTSGTYWRSWECVKTHKPEAANKPGTGSGNWKRVRLMRPLDEDGKLNADHWDRVPDAPKTHIAVWHGNRLFARNDAGIGGKQTLLYSRLAKVGDKDNIGKDVIGAAGNPQWDPDDWRAGGADGAGFQPFETEEGDPIVALYSFGYYLLVFKEESVHVIAGMNPETWTVRRLANTGASGAFARAELEGFVYFIGDEGLQRTDGTSVTHVPGDSKVDAWLRQAIDWESGPKDLAMWAHDGYLWITLATEKSQLNNMVLVYEPKTESFWPLDLSIQASCIQKRNGRDQLFFSGVNNSGKVSYPVFAWTGAAHASASTKTLGGVTTTNYFPNPNFGGGVGVWDGPLNWVPMTKVNLRVTKQAAHRGKFGVEIQNTRKSGDVGGFWAGYDGIFANLSPPAGSYLIQCVARRRAWDNKPKREPDVKFVVNNTLHTSGSEYLGNGWHRIWGIFTHGGGAADFGIVTGNNTTTQVDETLLTQVATLSANEGPKPYFDGNGGEDEDAFHFSGGSRPYLFQYDHEDAVDAETNYTDDSGLAAYTGDSIPWTARTAWLTFGALQEERRIRRLWSMVRANDAVIGLRTFRNFTGVDDGTYSESVQPDQGVVYHEGTLPEDAHAIQVEVEGNKSPAALLAVALDTEPRRIRFGRR